MFSSFMVNTWIAASMVAVIAGIIGFFVVLRGAEFVAHALPQGAFAGAAGAALIGANTILGLGTFALAGALGIAWLGRRSHHSVATALGLVVMLGLGSMFLSLSVEYGPEIYSLLFGEVIGVSRAELLPIVALGLVCSGAIAVLYRPLLFDSVMPGVSEAKGMSRAGINVVFLVVVALATSMTVPVVGAFLMFSLMVAPAAAARCLTDRPGRALALSAGIALVVVWAAIVASFESNWPIGFFVGTLGAFAYVVARAVQHLRGRNYRASRPVAPLVSAAFR
jgi:zinc/manganese transport system permease protein